MWDDIEIYAHSTAAHSQSESQGYKDDTQTETKNT